MVEGPSLSPEDREVLTAPVAERIYKQNFEKKDEKDVQKARIMQLVGAEMGMKVNITEAHRGEGETDDSFNSRKDDDFGIEIVGGPRDLSEFWHKVEERQAGEAGESDK